jgi:hypothetical protein
LQKVVSQDRESGGMGVSPDLIKQYQFNPILYMIKDNTYTSTFNHLWLWVCLMCARARLLSVINFPFHDPKQKLPLVSQIFTHTYIANRFNKLDNIYKSWPGAFSGPAQNSSQTINLSTHKQEGSNASLAQSRNAKIYLPNV